MANCCEFYPCHSGFFQEFSCEFCYCPEYFNASCSGNPKWIYVNEKTQRKDCSECLEPHKTEYINKYYKEKRDAQVSNRTAVPECSTSKVQ